MNFSKYKFMIVSCGIAVIVLILGLVLCLPLANQLSKKNKEAKTQEVELLKARDAIVFMKTMGSNLQLVTEENLPSAVDMLIKQGKLYHVDIISTNPQEPIQGKAYSMLAIDLVLESSYSDLCDFLGALDSLGNSVVKVDKFEVALSSDPARLKTKLTVNVHVLR